MLEVDGDYVRVDVLYKLKGIRYFPPDASPWMIAEGVLRPAHAIIETENGLHLHAWADEAEDLR